MGIDITTSSMVALEIEEGQDSLLGLSWDSSARRLVGLMQAEEGGLQLRTLDPLTGNWTISKLKGDTNFEALAGNSGTVKAFDSTTRTLFTLVCNPPANPNDDCIIHVASVDVATATLTAHPAIS